MSKWADRFPEYDAARPEIWELFKRFTFEAVDNGYKGVGANAVLGRIRWETAMKKAEGDEFKVNENFAVHYARKFARTFPEHAGLFRFKSTVAV